MKKVCFAYFVNFLLCGSDPRRAGCAGATSTRQTKEAEALPPVLTEIFSSFRYDEYTIASDTTVRAAPDTC